MAKKPKSVLEESKEIQLAVELIQFGARLQLLESEISLSRDRLINLYKELRGESPPKGMLPFSVDWFLTWKPNIHSSLFLGIYRQLVEHTDASGIQGIIKAYKLYLEQIPPDEGEEPILSLTRAWTLIRFLNSFMLTVTQCEICGGEFVVQPYAQHHFVCGLCHVPNRAGKTRKVAVATRIISVA
ncbi:flagellar transcriptional regulator FlhC [Methylobacter psychrophilus]|uniref:flagellar transcriptional regulator FlhC n=1 Tax=Methylobacter psychrophilus TaxID=96941 RepID=UPI0021D4F6A7|nr:flagellar transcriptional regulator FlhC [Methylobacter psychrophilus]